MSFSFAVKCFFLWLACCLSTAAEEKRPEIRFYSEIAAPYYWLDADGNPQGANMDLVLALSRLLPFEVTIEEIPWARACQEALQKPNIVLLSLLKTAKRENQFQWLGLYHNVRASLVRLSERNYIRPASLEEAKHYRIGTIRGYGSAEYLEDQGFQEHANLVLFPSTTKLWPMLFEKRIDLVVANLVSDRYEIASLGLDPSQIETAIDLPDLTLELQLATGTQTSPEVVKALRQAVQKIKDNGVFKQILQNWHLQ